MLVRVILLAWLGAALAPGADFGFSVIIRAGQNGAQDWELGIGSDPSTPSVTAQLTPPWHEGSARTFTVGYTAATNTAYVQVGNDLASFQPAGGGVLAAGGTWTLPAATFSVAASSVPSATSVSVANLQLTTGMAVLQGLSNTTLTAAQPGNSTAFQSLTTPVVLAAQGSSDWVLTGQIAFTGLAAATGSQLRFQLTANASDVPEPATYAMIGGGLLLLAAYRRGKGVRRYV